MSGVYQDGPIRSMMEKGMTALTGAPGWPDAWRTLFEKGDVVGIKVAPWRSNAFLRRQSPS